MMLISGLLKTPFCWFSEIKNLPNINTFEKVSIIPANSSLQYLSFCDLSIFVTKLKLRIQKVNPCSPNTWHRAKATGQHRDRGHKEFTTKKIKIQKESEERLSGQRQDHEKYAARIFYNILQTGCCEVWMEVFYRGQHPVLIKQLVDRLFQRIYGINNRG